MEQTPNQKYTCPMHPEVVKNEPGKCPKCGMTLVPLKDDGVKPATHHQHGNNPSMGMEGHNHHAMMINDFRKRFYIVLILTLPIMLLSTMIQHFMGVSWQFAGSQYMLLGLSTIVFFYG